MRDGEVLAALEVADGTVGRMRGLLGRDGIDGGFFLRPTRSVHTIGMRFAIDVAFCDRSMRVLDTVCMAPNRIGRPRLRARSVIEAEAGAFERWKLRPGDELEIKE
ncbi:MAG: DUF192 domain-containing protein [Acidimicrobiales bacterium]